MPSLSKEASSGHKAVWGVAEGSFLWAAAVLCQLSPPPTAKSGSRRFPRPGYKLSSFGFAPAGAGGAQLVCTGRNAGLPSPPHVWAITQTRVPTPSRDSGTQAHTPLGARVIQAHASSRHPPHRRPTLDSASYALSSRARRAWEGTPPKARNLLLTPVCPPLPGVVSPFPLRL